MMSRPLFVRRRARKPCRRLRTCIIKCTTQEQKAARGCKPLNNARRQARTRLVPFACLASTYCCKLNVQRGEPFGYMGAHQVARLVGALGVALQVRRCGLAIGRVRLVSNGAGLVGGARALGAGHSGLQRFMQIALDQQNAATFLAGFAPLQHLQPLTTSLHQVRRLLVRSASVPLHACRWLEEQCRQATSRGRKLTEILSSFYTALSLPALLKKHSLTCGVSREKPGMIACAQEGTSSSRPNIDGGKSSRPKCSAENSMPPVRATPPLPCAVQVAALPG